jgi:creatine kinase
LYGLVSIDLLVSLFPLSLAHSLLSLLLCTDNVVAFSVMTPHLGVGVTAGDEESWEVFKDLMNPVIKGWHGYDPETQKHVSDLNPDNLKMDEKTVELFNKYVASTRIRAARNISGESCSPHLTPSNDNKNCDNTIIHKRDLYTTCRLCFAGRGNG